MKILIIEDEQPAARHLSRLLKQYDPSMAVLDVIASVRDAVAWFGINEQPDLVFMDIQLADALSFRIMEQVEIRAPIIFTTAYDQYALRAFRENSIDYLLKPVDLEDLRKSFDKLRRLSTTNRAMKLSTEQIASAWKMLSRQYKSRFVIKIGDYIRWVPTEEIQCYYSKDKITFLVNEAGRSYPIDYSLTDVEGMTDPALFFRISRQYIVRADAIKELVSYSSSRLKVVMKKWENDGIIVSRERVGLFKEWLDQ